MFPLLLFLVMGVFLWAGIAFIDYATFGPTTTSHEDVERFIREDKLRLNMYHDEIITYNSRLNPDFDYVSRMSPTASWIPGVHEYVIAKQGNETGWRVKNGSRLYHMIKEEHNILKNGNRTNV